MVWIIWIELSKRKNLQVPLGCISHTLDPCRFGAWYTHTHSLSLSLSFSLSMQRYCALKLQLFKLKFMLVLVLVLVWWINWRKFVVVWTSKQFGVDCVPYLEFHFCIQLIKGIIFLCETEDCIMTSLSSKEFFFPLLCCWKNVGKRKETEFWILVFNPIWFSRK